MALIKCPEYGRENVSDSAEMCLNCWYGIKRKRCLTYMPKLYSNEE